MKRAYLLSAIILAFASVATLPTTTYASTNVQATTSTPSAVQLATKIAEVKALENYATYSELSNDLLEYVTDYATEYRYLFSLVATAESMLANYDQTPASDLNMIMAAADDAIISCNLKFGVTKRQHDDQEKAQSQSKPAVTAPTPEKVTPVTPQVSHSTAITSQTTPAPTNTKPTIADQPSTTTVTSKPETEIASTASQPDVEIPATSSPAPTTAQAQSGALDSHPVAFVIITAAGLSIILALIISSRHKSYHPGRKA